MTPLQIDRQRLTEVVETAREELLYLQVRSEHDQCSPLVDSVVLAGIPPLMGLGVDLPVGQPKEGAVPGLQQPIVVVQCPSNPLRKGVTPLELRSRVGVPVVVRLEQELGHLNSTLPPDRLWRTAASGRLHHKKPVPLLYGV